MQRNKKHLPILALVLILFSTVLVSVYALPSNPSVGSGFYDGTNWARKGQIINPEMVLALPGWNNPALSILNPNGIQEPSVIYEGGTFKMWFVAINATGYTEEGYATSTDGINWSIYPNPVMVEGGGGAFYTLHTYVFRNGTTNYMLYTATVDRTIALYISANGINWTLGEYEALIGWEPGITFGNMAVIYKDGTYAMYYEWREEGEPWKIGYADSTDGITFNSYGGLYKDRFSNSGYSLGGQYITREADNYFYLWLHKSRDLLLPTEIFLIKFTTPNDFFGPYVYYPDSNPRLSRYSVDEGPDTDLGQVADPSPIVVNGVTYLFYTATNDQARFVIKLAMYDPDAIHGTPLILNLFPIIIIAVGLMLIFLVIQSELEPIPKIFVSIFAIFLITEGFSTAIAYIFSL